MRKPWRLVFIILFVVLSFSYRPSSAQEDTARYFPETGYSVKGDFLKKFNSVTDPIKVFGYPITEEIIAPASSPVAGLKIQYFQKARFEYHPSEPPGSQVQIGDLGMDLFALEKPGEPPLVLAKNHPACRYYEATGNQVCYAFLNFLDAHGGTDLFGMPISNIVIVNGRLVQYFEKARFEWHAELPSGQRVVLTNLGLMFFDLYEDPSLQKRNADEPNIPNTVLDLKVHAFPLLSVMPANGSQTIYILVLDQQSRPVQNTQITLTFRNANGVETKHTLIGTNPLGVTQLNISLRDQPIGLVEVIVDVNLNSQIKQQTRTSFRIWW
ncbi:MAG: hypothetical protein MUC85_01200 [Anaerolineales bacterium]|jgi:hypothetical protein|nr:hypothetical protein [Anaerolineales bacterium]